MKRNGKETGRRFRRRATALVEFAIVAPMLFTILFGIVEYGYVYMVRQTMTNAAREGCRVGILQSTSEADVLSIVDTMMAPTGVSTYATVFTPATADDPINTVVISTTYDAISLLPGFFSQVIGDISVSCSMREEGATGT